MRSPFTRIWFLLLLSGALAQAASPALQEAVDLFNQRRVPEARDVLLHVTAGEPANAEAWLYLGRAQQRMQQRQEAVDSLEKALKLAPADPRIVAEYGGACLQRAGQMGMSFGAMGLARKGRDSLEKAVQLAPEVIDYRLWLVEFYRNAPGIVGGGMSKAYAQAAEIEKRDATRGRFVRGALQAHEKKYDDAVTTFQAVLQDHPDHYGALFQLGRLASESGQHLAEGEAGLRRCLELKPADNDPSPVAVHYRLGLIAEKRADPAQARREFGAALALQNDFAPAREALSRLK